MKSIKAVSPVLLSLALATSLLSAGPASARPVHHAAKAHKTHRLIAGSKSIRINDSGEVITDRHP